MLTRNMLMTATITALLGTISSSPAAATDSIGVLQPGKHRMTMSSYQAPARQPQPPLSDPVELALVLMGSSVLLGIGVSLHAKLQPVPVVGKRQHNKNKRRNAANGTLRDAHQTRASRHNGQIQPTNWR